MGLKYLGRFPSLRFILSTLGQSFAPPHISVLNYNESYQQWFRVCFGRILFWFAQNQTAIGLWNLSDSDSDQSLKSLIPTNINLLLLWLSVLDEWRRAKEVAKKLKKSVSIVIGNRYKIYTKIGKTRLYLIC